MSYNYTYAAPIQKLALAASSAKRECNLARRRLVLPPVRVHHTRRPGYSGRITVGLTMRKCSLLLAAMLAVSFSTVADAAKKKSAAPPKDAASEWNMKNMPPMMTTPAAAKPAKAVSKSKKKAKKS